jgi:hypothetical protein
MQSGSHSCVTAGFALGNEEAEEHELSVRCRYLFRFVKGSEALLVQRRCGLSYDCNVHFQMYLIYVYHIQCSALSNGMLLR